MIPNIAKPTSEIETTATSNARLAEERERDHRIGLAVLPDHEGDEAGCRDGQEPDRLHR